MMFATISLMADPGSKKLNENIGQKIGKFITSEALNFGYYLKIRHTMTTDLLGDTTKKLKGRDLAVFVTKLFLFNIFNLSEDLNTDKLGEDFKPEELIDVIFKFIEQIKDVPEINQLNKCFNQFKLCYPVMSGYSYDDAFQILNNNIMDEESLASFIKIFILSDDYFNVDRLFEMRERILSSDYLKDFHNFFGKLDGSKGIMEMFLADYKFMIPMLNGQMEGYYDYENFSHNFEYIIAIMYGTFLLNMSSFIYTNRIQFKFSEKNAKDKLQNTEGKYKLDIILNKLINRLDFEHFRYASRYMSENEVFLFIIRKIYDDVLFHEANTISFEKISRFYSFMVGITRSINANSNEAIIDEMVEVATKEWNNLNTLSHIQMIEFLKKNKRFADTIKARGVERNLKERLKEVCKQNNFPYIEGLDMFTGAGRKKSSSNNTENQEKKKRTKKMA